MGGLTQDFRTIGQKINRLEPLIFKTDDKMLYHIIKHVNLNM